jgi:hypothetical protein
VISSCVGLVRKGHETEERNSVCMGRSYGYYFCFPTVQALRYVLSLSFSREHFRIGYMQTNNPYVVVCIVSMENMVL